MNFYYTSGSYPNYGSQSSSILDKAELAKIQAGFDKLPDPTGFPNNMVKCKFDGTGLDLSVVTLTTAGAMAGLTGMVFTSGTISGITGLTLASGPIAGVTSISMAGPLTGATGITSSGAINFTTASSIDFPAGTMHGALNAGGFKITNAAAATAPGDLCNLSTVNAILVAGGTPGSVNVTDLNKGTATANQFLKIVGSAVAGVTVAVTDMDVGTATAGQVLSINAAGNAVVGNSFATALIAQMAYTFNGGL